MILESFHFIRPTWLFAFGIMILLVRMAVIARRWENQWRCVCDAHLLDHMQIKGDSKSSRYPLLLLIIGWSIAIIALAGPTWERMPQQAFKGHARTVILFDTSLSMNAMDIAPSRLVRGLFKVHDILKRVSGGQAALIVFTDEPYVVSPLTDDVEVIENILPIISPAIMPSQGSRVDRAIDKALELIKNSNALNTQILLISDGGGVNNEALKTAEKVAKAGHTLSVLAVGTLSGAPVPKPEGGFVTVQDGSLIISKINKNMMIQLANAGGGNFSYITADERDIDTVITSKTIGLSGEEVDIRVDVWRDFGVWVLLLLLPLAPVAFRRGWIVVFIVVMISVSRETKAANLEDFLYTSNQKGALAFSDNRPEDAAVLFTNKSWKGVALFRAEKFEESAEVLKDSENVEDLYNLGNAYAWSNKFKEAIEAYEKALKISPEHEDAKINKEIIEKLMEDQDKDEGEGEGDSSDDQSDGQNDNQDQNQDNGGEDSSDNQSNGQNDNQDQNQDNGGEDSSDNQSNGQNDNQDQNQDNGGEDSSEQPQQQQQPQPQPQPSNRQPEKKTEGEQAVEHYFGSIPEEPYWLLREKMRRTHAKKRYKKSQETEKW